MFRKKTLFILGAGASHEVGLPVGKDLTKKIAQYLDIGFEWATSQQTKGNKNIGSALRHFASTSTQNKDASPYLEACRRICFAMPQAASIDSFIDNHRGDDKIEFCGKLAIVESILATERSGSLFFDEMESQRRINFASIGNTWFHIFWEILTDRCHKTEIEDALSTINFIIFNYDRCLEHFLFNSLQNCYGVSRDDAADLLRIPLFVHPYGHVGHLPWQDSTSGVQFGKQIGFQSLLSQREQVRTFSEQIKDKGTLNRIHQLMREAETIVFLGFAFHTQNMELLKSPKRGVHKKVFATAYQFSNSNVEILRNRIGDTINATGFTLDVENQHTCTKLLNDYRLSIALP